MRLHGHGLGVDVPHGWDVRVYRRFAEFGETSNPVVHAATFPLPRERGDFGSNAVDLMGPDDVLVVLFEYDPEASRTVLFRAQGRPRPLLGEFSPHRLHRALPGQSGGQWFFTEAGRAFSLYVVLGSHRRRAALVPVARRLVDSLQVGPR